MKKYDLTISLVMFKSDPELVNEAIESVYRSRLDFKFYLIDNSSTDSLRSLKKDDRCEYIHTGKNLGFGKAHNIAMARALTESNYHLILNPDVYFGENTLEPLITFMKNNPDVGQIMPKVCYPNGKIQRLCKLLPSPVDLFGRRFFPWFPGATQRNIKYELQETGYDKVMNIPYLSGCFMFFRTTALQDIGLFDDRIFMYIEDADITRRMHLKYKTIFLPLVTIYHHYAKGSYKSLKLMAYNVHGAFVYFNKWGWFFDSSRKSINQKVVSTYLERKRS